MRPLLEACQPYNRRLGGKPPVDIWEILDRLNEDELKSLAMGYSLHAPAPFEQQLLGLGNRRRQPTGQMVRK